MFFESFRKVRLYYISLKERWYFSIWLLTRITVCWQTFLHIISIWDKYKVKQTKINRMVWAGINAPEASTAGSMKFHLSLFYGDVLSRTLPDTKSTRSTGFINYSIFLAGIQTDGGNTGISGWARLPAPYGTRVTGWNLWGCFSTYIDRKVKEISGAIDSLKFMDFITSAAALCGQMVNYKTISDAASIDQVTAKNWLGILERLGIVFYLHPYSNNMLKRMVTKPKLYFYDCGLVA